MNEIFFLSLKVALTATIINLPISILIAWVLTKTKIPGRSILDLIILIPLAIPPVIVGFFLLIIFGKNGPLGSLINNIFGSNIIFTWIAAVLASSIVSIPLMVRPIIVSMSDIDENLEKSARILGASYIKSFISITLPLSYKGITAGILLGFIRAFSEFGATIIVAGNIPGKTQTVPLAIYTNIITGNNDEVFKMVAICLALSITSILIYTKLLSTTRK